MAFEYIKSTLESFDRVTDEGFDRVVLVLGDERVGKSTLMMACVTVWREMKDRATDPDSIIDQLVWAEHNEFRRKIADDEPESAIAVQDAVNVLHKKQSMDGDQVDLQKTFNDMGFKRHLVFLGYQDYDDIPTFLQKRRATNAFVIPTRGHVKGYNRNHLNERYTDGVWPDPVFKDRFPNLDETALGKRYKEIDHGRKEERIIVDSAPDPDDARKEVKKKVVIRALKPWRDDVKLTQNEAGKLVDYSRSWVKERLREWERGEIDVTIPPRYRKSQDMAEAD